MVYLIGGKRGVGKTHLSKKIAQEKNIPYISTDVLFNALRYAYPSLGLTKDPWKEVFFGFLQSFIRQLEHYGEDFIIEGDAFDPEHVEKLKESASVTAIFLGNSDDADAKNRCGKCDIRYVETVKNGTVNTDEAFTFLCEAM